MKIYKFNKKNLTFEKVKTIHIVFYLKIIIVVSCLIGFISNYYFGKNISNELMAIVINNEDNDKFTLTKFKEYLKELNIKNQHIVIAQAILETNNFNSNIFIENNNLFGMKVATQRPTTNKGENNNHAYYDTWRESVQDYAFYSATYLNKLKTEDDYFEFLSQYYAEDTNYVNKLKNIIEKRKLK
jgi:uncharacterized FlgJ-related protein